MRTSLAQAIEAIWPRTPRPYAVLDYYQPIPEPAQIAKGTSASGLHTNLVCSGLKPNAARTFAAAQIVLAALNRAVAGAVADARAHHVENVTLVDVSGMRRSTVTGSARPHPWVFSGEPVPDTTLAADAEHVLAAKACTGTETAARGGELLCVEPLDVSAQAAERGLQDYVWRAAHPTADGQRALAATVERQLHGRV